MPNGEPRPEDWEVLGVEPDAPFDRVAAAYRRRRALYAEGALASYMLLEDDERVALLLRIDAAWKRISSAQAAAARSGSARIESIPAPDAGAPDPEERPGAYLRHKRLLRGLSLEAIATETKIRPSLLSRLENDEVDGMPAPVYVRGFVLQVARMMGLAEADSIAAAYVRRLP